MYSASGAAGSRRPRFTVAVLIGSVLSVLIHLLFGWAWTAIIAIMIGFTVGKRGWLAGSVSVTLGWSGLVTYSFVVAPGASIRMSQTFAGILGNLPGPATVALTLLIAVIIGMLGGLLGSLLAAVRRSQRHIEEEGVPA